MFSKVFKRCLMGVHLGPLFSSGFHTVSWALPGLCVGDAVVELFLIIIFWEFVNLLTLIGELLLLIVFIHFLCLSKETLRLALRAGSTKEKSPSLRNFLPYQAKTVLFVPRRYHSCLSERPAYILNRGKFDCEQPFGFER